MCVLARHRYHPSSTGPGKQPLPDAPVDPRLVLTAFWRCSAKQLVCFFMIGSGKWDKQDSLLNFCFSFFFQHAKIACGIVISCHMHNIITLNGSKLLFWKSTKQKEEQIGGILHSSGVVWRGKKAFEQNVGWIFVFVFVFWGGEVFCITGRADFQDDL